LKLPSTLTVDAERRLRRAAGTGRDGQSESPGAALAGPPSSRSLGQPKLAHVLPDERENGDGNLEER
jgi:hypothetical protein